MKTNFTSLSTKAASVLFIAALFLSQASAQSVSYGILGTAGNGEIRSVRDPKPSISFSFGEVCVGSVNSNDGGVDQGFEKIARVMNPVSVEERFDVREAVSVSAYPAPFVSSLHIQINAGDVSRSEGVMSVIDVSGNKVSIDYPVAVVGGSNTYTLNLNGLTKGIYFVRIVFPNSPIAEKIVKVVKIDENYHPY